MVYYQLNSFITWFEGDLMYINNLSNKETAVYKILEYNIGFSNKLSIFLYKEWLNINEKDKIIILNINQMLDIIKYKKREVKLNKLLYDI